MQPFTNKQLYIMNGGNKLYINKDGFGDVYNATAAEEAEWAQEVIAAALEDIDTSENSTQINCAADNLRFHGYEGLKELLSSKLAGASIPRRSAFQTILSKTKLATPDAEIQNMKMIYQDLVVQGNENMYEVFSQFEDLKSHAAKLFILTCVEGSDDELFIRATVTLGRWAYSGLPALRQNRLLETLQPENRHLPAFRAAVEQLTSIFQLQTQI